MNRIMITGAAMLMLSAAPAFAQAKKAPARAGAGSDQAFVMDAAKGGMAEVELGKLAVEKASNADVKKFGQRMVDDHSKANDELKMVVSTKNITLPSGPNATQKATYDRLSKLSGAQFDAAYMRDMVNDHVKDVAAFRREAQGGKDSDIKAFAAKTLPTLEDHLKMARMTDQQVVSASSSKGHSASSSTSGARAKTPKKSS
jgi:putative membrane protein